MEISSGEICLNSKLKAAHWYVMKGIHMCRKNFETVNSLTLAIP